MAGQNEHVRKKFSSLDVFFISLRMEVLALYYHE